MTMTTDPLSPPDDLLQQPFVPMDAGALESVLAEVDRRFPALAEFHAKLGDTELREVPSVPGGARIVAKCEWQNPVGSIKDRTGYALLADALHRFGKDHPAEPLKIVAYSGGDLAEAMSLLGSMTGVATRFVLASFVPESLLRVLDARGSVVDLVPKERGFILTIRTAQRIAAAEPEWTLVFQHANPANVAFHELTTGGEIVRQLGGTRPDLWVASIGSGGTLIGVLRSLRRRFPGVRAVGVTPAEAPYGQLGPPLGKATYEGSGGHGYGIRQPIVKAHDDWIHAHRQVPCGRAIAAMGEFFDLTGTKIGSSAAANWLVAKEYAAELGPGATIVTVFPCAGTPEQWAGLGRQ
jgi:cysteine synthase A